MSIGKEKHFSLGNRFTVKVYRRGSTYEWAVYPNMMPHLYVASGSSHSITQARKDARKLTAMSVRRMRREEKRALNIVFAESKRRQLRY